MNTPTCPRCGLTPQEHPANRCLDAWVAEAVFGYTLHWAARDKPVLAEEDWDEVPAYSDIDDSLCLLERLRQQGWLWVLKGIPEGFPWRANDDVGTPLSYKPFCLDLTWMPTGTDADARKRIRCRPLAVADTLPLVICRGALLAVAEEENNR